MASFQPSRARSPIDIAADNWADRIDSLVASGVKKKRITQRVIPLMQEDLAKVKAGGAGVGNESAVLQVGSALAGKPLLAPKPEKSGWSPDDFFGDVTGDIADLTWRGIPALARYAADLPNKTGQAIEATPHILGGDNKWLKEHGYETQDGANDMAKLRNYAKTPIFDLIPGLHTASSATTPEGRMELAHHPVSTALDILPDAQVIAKGVGLAGKVGATEGSALEAAAEAKPVKALYRTVVPEARRAAIAEKTVSGLRKVGLDPQSFGLARGLDIEHRKTRLAFEKSLKDNPIIDDIAKLPDEERTLLAHEAAYPDQHPELSVEHERMLERIQDFNDRLAEGNPNLTTIERTREVPVAEEPPAAETPEGPPAGHRRLYRATRSDGSIIDTGADVQDKLFFADTPEGAKKYGDQVSYIDVPEGIADKNYSNAVYDLSSESPDPTGRHYTLPKDYVEGKLKPVEDPLTSTNPIPDDVKPDLMKARDLRRRAMAGEGDNLIAQAEQIENDVLDRVEAPIDPKTGRKSFDFGYDDTGASNIGYEGGYYAGGKGRGTRDTTPEQAAEETAYLQERQANMDRDYVREEDRRKGARREEPRAGGRRASDAQSFMEAHLMDLRNGDPAAMNAINDVYRQLSPEARQQFLAEQNAEFRRLPEEAQAQREVQAQKAEEAGLDELAAAWRKDVDTPGLEPPPGTAEEAARIEKELQEYTKQGGRKGEYKVKAVEEAARARGEGFDTPKPKTREVTDRYVYPSDSEVARAHRAMVAAEEKAKGVTAAGEQRLRGEEALQVTRDLKNVDVHAGRVRRAEARVESARQAVAKAQQAAEHGRGATRTLDNSLTRLEKAMKNLEYRQGKAAEAGAKLDNTRNRSIDAQVRKMDKAKTSAMDKAETFEEAFKKNPPANMVPILERIIREKVQRLAEGQPWPVGPDGQPLHVSEVVSAADYIDDATRQIQRHDMRNLLSEQEYADIRRDVLQNWQKVADEGYHPVWTHNVEVERAGYVPTTKPLPTRNARLSQVRERVGDLTPHIDDIAVSMTHALAEHIRDVATKRYLGEYIQPHTRTWSDIAPELHRTVDILQSKGKIPRGLDEAGALQYALNRDWVEWNPEAIFETQKPKLTGTATVGDTKTYLPRNIAKIADDLIGYEPGPIAKGAGAVSRLYKTSIMAFSMKHMAHILFGGTVFLGLRGGIEEAMSLGKAIRMVKEGEMPAELSRHLDIDTPDQLFQYSAGNKLGQMYAKSLGNVAKAKMKFDEFVSNVQRTTAYLGEESRGLKRGMSAAEAKELGLRHAYKTLVDIDGMNPLERNVLRQVMPFYAFMRHTLKYILTYPIDHPMRAAILSRMSDIEQKDWNSGLPEQLQSLFFLGSPDKNGNVTGIEMRQFNPFRDTGSYFTLAGFFKSIHPAAALPFTLAGGDKFTGASALYPEVEYDERTGNLVAKRPKNAPWEVLETIVPEAGIIDHFAGLTQDLKDLKARDPEAYKARLWQMAFVPFEPKRVNVANEAAEIQAARLAVAQQDVSNAFQSGRTGSLQQYQMVPYQGELVPPENITNVINYLQQIRPDVAPRSVIPQTELSRL